MTEEALFAAALKQPTPEARRAWLDRACADQPAMRQRLETLLRAHDDAGSFLAAAAAVEAAQADRGQAEHGKAERGNAVAAADRNTPASEPTQAETTASAPADLAFLSPPTTPGSLGRLAHYEAVQVLGQGGFGVVLKARDTVLERLVAIKVLSGPLISAATARQRFIREARASAAVIHDNVVTIHEVSKDDLPYLVMQYIHGCTLQDKLDRSGPLEVKEILRIGMQIASGLAAAHAQGVVHRDIKPANILLENGVERVKITDFGLARLVDDASVTQSGIIAGTPQYMAPEQAQGETVDHRADVFSLGSVLYALCTGHPPFRASGAMAVLQRVIEDTPRPVRESNAEIPEWLEAIIARLHAKRPEERFQTAAEVAQLLGQHLAHLQQPGLAPMSEPAPPPAAPAVALNESSWPTALLVLYLVPGCALALVIEFFFLLGSGGRPLGGGPSTVAVGLMAISVLVLVLVGRQAWPRRTPSAGAPLPAVTRRPLWPMVLLGVVCLVGIMVFIGLVLDKGPQSFRGESLLLPLGVAAIYGFVVWWWAQPVMVPQGMPAAPPASPSAGLFETLLRLGGGVLGAGMLFCYIFAILAALAGIFDVRAPLSFLVAAGLCAATSAAALAIGRRWGSRTSRAGAIWLNAGLVLAAAAFGFGAAYQFNSRGRTQPTLGEKRDSGPRTEPAPDPRIDGLRRLVDLQVAAVERAKQRVAAQVETPDILIKAQIELIEAQIRLAETEQQRDRIAELGKELIQHNEERLALFKQLFDVGRVTAGEVAAIERQVIEARLRFPAAPGAPRQSRE